MINVYDIRLEKLKLIKKNTKKQLLSLTTEMFYLIIFIFTVDKVKYY